MIRMTYFVAANKIDEEISWLRSIGVYPAIQDSYNHDNNSWCKEIGAIVSEETAITIKLRNKINFQAPWRIR